MLVRPAGLIHEFAPPSKIEAEISVFTFWANDYASTLDPLEVAAAWVHHRFVQIHPFQVREDFIAFLVDIPRSTKDGNCRMARALASLVLMKRGLLLLVVSFSAR